MLVTMKIQQPSLQSPCEEPILGAQVLAWEPIVCVPWVHEDGSAPFFEWTCVCVAHRAGPVCRACRGAGGMISSRAWALGAGGLDWDVSSSLPT